jgi:trigger factor
MPSPNQPLLDLDINNMKDIDFTYEVGLSPEVKFNFLDSKPTFTKYKVGVEDHMLNEEIDRIRKRFAKYEYPENVEENDILSFTIEELNADGSVREDGANNVTSLMLDMLKESARPAVLALKKHESTTLNIWESLDRGKEEIIKHILNVTDEMVIPTLGDNFKLTLNNITRSLPADMNEEFFVKAFGENGPKTEAEMRENITKDLESYFSGQADSYLTNELYNALMEKVELPLPDDFMKRWVKTANEKEISDEQIEKEYPMFSKQIRWNLIVKKIITDQQITVSEQELRDRVKVDTIAQMYSYGLRNIGDEWVDQFIEKQLKDKQYMDKTREQILDNKALEYVKTKITLSEKPISFEDFKALVEKKG